MNNINIKASVLSESLQQIVGVVERKQTMPILSHILLDCSENSLTLTATDLEVDGGLGAFAAFADPYAID